MNYAIILAGGIGSRFWPLSTSIEPKQFLNLCTDRSLLNECLGRISSLIGKENIYIATNKIYKAKINNCVKKINIPFRNLLFEPESKNTFAPIGILSNRIFNKDKEAIIIVLPSDHLIKNKDRFLKTLEKAIEVAKDRYIVTLGIVPQRPETGYGYIKVDRKQKIEVYGVDKFIEKPSIQKAKRFIKDKRFYWNSGIFIFKAEVLLEEIKNFEYGIYNIIMKIKNKKDLNKIWPRFKSISIDCAIMEKTEKIALLPLDCGWLDLGSWQAVEEIIKKDKNGNIFKGNHIDLGSKNTSVWSGKRLVATLGLENVIIVDTECGLLICHKDRVQDVRKIIQAIKK